MNCRFLGTFCKILDFHDFGQNDEITAGGLNYEILFLQIAYTIATLNSHFVPKNRLAQPCRPAEHSMRRHTLEIPYCITCFFFISIKNFSFGPKLCLTFVKIGPKLCLTMPKIGQNRANYA